MIYQPRNVQPSHLSIDGTEDNMFTMEVNTNNYIDGYQLTILNWDNTVKYSGNKMSLSDVVYNGDTLNIPVSSDIGLSNGTNYKWYVKLYQPTSDMLITYGNVRAASTYSTIYIQNNINIKVGMKISIGTETRNITGYSQGINYATLSVDASFSSAPAIGTAYNIYSDFIQTVPEYVTYIRANPIVSISNMPSSVVKKYFTFEGSYSQTDNVAMVYHQWNLYLVKSNGGLDLIHSTGKVYNANLDYYYDGFKNLQTYKIELIAETEFGIVADSGLQTFTVTYDTIEYLQKPVSTLLPSKNAIQVDWTAPTDFTPLSYNDSKALGYIQFGEITGTSFYINPGLKDIVTVENMSSNYDSADTISVYYIPEGTSTQWQIDDYINSYNPNTGEITTVGYADFSEIEASYKYLISGYTGGQMDGVDIIENNPYLGSNSAKLQNYSLIYHNEHELSGMAVYPDNYNITMQFKPDKNFFYGPDNVYSDTTKIAEINASNDDGYSGDILIFAHDYDMCAVKAQSTDWIADFKAIPAPPEGEENTVNYVYLLEDIDLEQTSYITFVNENYMEKIISFDHETFKATFYTPLPFIPQVNNQYLLMETLSTPFYTNTNEVFAIQQNAVPASNNDYTWIDEGNVWIDSGYYWVEGGTPIDRISEYWWKLQITNNNIKLEKGGS